MMDLYSGGSIWPVWAGCFHLFLATVSNLPLTVVNFGKGTQ
jgi:hypothetical protein